VGPPGEALDQATLARLVAQVDALPPPARDIAAAVTGVANGDGARLLGAVKQLTPYHLGTLRTNFRRMNV
jgi:hypothetical protein